MFAYKVLTTLHEFDVVSDTINPLDRVVATGADIGWNVDVLFLNVVIFFSFV
jgi:hypothetical protein